MGSSVIESHPAPKFAERGQQYQPYPSVYETTYHRPPGRLQGSPLPYTSPMQGSKGPFVLAPAEGWLALLLLAIAVSVVVYAIISARWVNHTSILFGSAALGLLIGLFIAKVQRIPQAILHLGACLVGHWFSVWLISALAFHISWLVVLATLRTAITGGLSPTAGGDIVFLFYLSFLCYYLGYFGAWLTYRAHLPWLVALVYCSVLLINLNYVKQDFSFLILVLLACLILLVARIHLVTKLTSWMNEGLQADRSWLRKTTRHFMLWTSILTLFVLGISSLLPIQAQPAAGTVFWNDLDNAWANISHGKISIQDPVSLLQPYQGTADFFNDHLTLVGNISLPHGEVLYYSSSVAPQYLEGFTFDHFDGHTWTLSLPVSRKGFPASTALPGDIIGGNYTQATTDVFVVNPPSDTNHFIFAPAQPIAFTVPASVNVNGFTSDWMSQSPLSMGEHYRATSNIPTSAAQDLSTIPLPVPASARGDSIGVDITSRAPARGAPTLDVWTKDKNYKILVTYYLQTPGDLSPQVAAIARQWTHGATSTYAAVKMLEAHLKDPTQFTYSLTNPPIPDNIDAVSWLLRTHQGYCTHYATAMTMMARLLGIPARVVNGFSYGQFDPKRKVWVVDGMDAHSWVQIYFPDYGWINFDPTPGFSLQASSLVTNPAPIPSPTVNKHPARPTPTSRSGINSAPTQQPTHPVTGVAQHVGSSQGLLLQFSVIAVLFVLFFVFLAFCSYWWRGRTQGLVPTNQDRKFISNMFWQACRVASWAGMPPRGWQTPYEYSSMLSRQVPYEAAPLRRLTDLFVRDRWAAPHETPYVLEEDDLERLWPHLRRVLVRLLILRVSNMIRGSRRD
jgi:hypothetical protein